MARLEPCFPKSHGTPRVDGRRLPSGLLSTIRSGLRSCGGPREHGSHKTHDNRWKRWSEKVCSHGSRRRMLACRPRVRCGLVPRSLAGQAVTPCIPDRKSRGEAVRNDKRRTAPLVTLLRNARPGSDQAHVRKAQGLAAHRHRPRPLPEGLLVRHRAGRSRRLPALTLTVSGAWNSARPSPQAPAPRPRSRSARSIRASPPPPVLRGPPSPSITGGLAHAPARRRPWHVSRTPPGPLASASTMPPAGLRY